jgi:autotransporter-associated beta strand protein
MYTHRVPQPRPLSFSLSRFTSTLAVAAVLAASTSTQAQNVFWDPGVDGDTLLGGTGIWDLTSTFWDPTGTDPAIPDNVVWPNVATSIAVFQGTAGVVTIDTAADTGVTANGLTFNVGGYTIASAIAAETLTFAGVSPTVTVTNALDTATINSIIAGSTGFTKSGLGTLVLGGVNTYSGPTAINAGVISISATGNLGNASATNTISINGGTLRNTGATVDLGATRAITIGASGATLDVTGTNVLTVSSVVSGTGNLSKTGNGILNLRGAAASTYTGAINITGGRIDFQNDNQLGNADNDILLDGGRLDYTSGAADWDPAATRVITIGPGGGTLGGSRAIRITDAGQITGSGTLIREATSAVGFGLDIQQANTGFTGNTIVNSGVIEFRNNQALGNTPGQTVTVNGGRFTVAVNAGNFVPTLSQPVTLNGGTLGFGNQIGGVYAGNVNLTADSSINVSDFYQNANRGGSITGVLSGTNRLTVSGTTAPIGGTPSIGSVLLTNPANTYSGTLSIGGGAHVRSIQGVGIDTLSSATVELNGGGVGLGPVVPAAGASSGFFGRFYTSAKINNGVVGGFDFGSESVLFARNDPLINYPTLAPSSGFINSGTLWTGILQVTTGGTYAFSTRSDDGSILYVNGQQIAANDFSQGATERFGSINLNPGLYPIIVKYAQGGGGASMEAFYQGPDTASVKVPLGSVASSITNNGAALFAPMTFDNNITVVAGGGDIDLAGANATTTGAITFNAGAGALRVTGVTGFETLTHSGPITLNGNNTISAGVTLTGSQTNTHGHSSAGADIVISSNIGEAVAGSGITKSGPRTLTLTGTNTFTGPIIVNGGKLVGTTSSLATAITDNATVEFNQVANGTFSNVISGTGELIKSGAGTLFLNGANTYTGGTTVAAGTLTGTGSLASTVTVPDTGNIAGTAGNTFTVGGVVLNPHSNANFALGAPSLIPLINSTGTVAGNVANINVTDAGGFAVGTYRLIDYGGAPLTPAQFAGFARVTAPGGFLFGLANNTTDTAVDLTVESTGALNTWTGSVDGVWDTSTANWNSGNFANGQRVTFPDGPANRNITGIAVSPQGITVNSSAGNDYTIANVIGGTLAAGLQKSGSSILRLTGANTYTGAINVTAGTVRANVSSAASGLGSGALTLANGTTLELDPTANIATNGLTGRYFTTAPDAATGSPTNTALVDFTQSSSFGAVVVQTDTNFDPAAYSTTNRPAGGAVGYQEGTGTSWRSFAIERTGKINITTAGWYAFYTASDDGSKIFLDGKLVANSDGPHGVISGAGTVFLTADLHDFRYEFAQGGGGADEQIQWSGPGIAKATLPSSVVFTAESASPAGSSNDTYIGTPIKISGSTTIKLNGTQYIGVGIGTIESSGGTLNVTGEPAKDLRATGTFLNGSLTINNTPKVALGRMDDSGTPYTLTKAGSGTLILDNTASGAGASRLSLGTLIDVQGGTLRAVGSSQFGASNPLGLASIRLSGGNLELDSKLSQVAWNNAIDVQTSARLGFNVVGVPTSIDAPVTIAANQTLTLDVAGGSRNAQGGFGGQVATTTAVFNGTISGGGGLSIDSTQTNLGQSPAAPVVAFAGPLTYTGLTQIKGFVHSQTQLELRGNATLLNSSGVNAVGKLALSNTRLNVNNGANVNLGDRIPDALPIELTNSTLRFDGADLIASSETIGAITLKAGQNNLFGGTVGGTAFNTVTAAGITREGRATLRVDGNNLGSTAPATTNGVRFIFTDSTGFNEIGGGGSTATNVSIVPWVWGAPTGNNRSLVTYDTQGLRTLLDAEYKLIAASTDVTDNIRQTFNAATTIGAVGTQTVNSFVPTNTAAADQTLTLLTGFTLNVTSGALLLNTTDGTARRVTLAGGTVNFGTAEGVIVASRREHTIMSQLSGSNGLTITGDGSVVLNQTTNNFSGLITVTGGGSPVTGGVQLLAQDDASLGNVDNDITLDGAGMRFQTAFTASATRTFTLSAANGTLDTGGGNSTVAGQVTGPGGLFKVGGNTLTLNNSANNYQGETHLLNGSLVTNTGPQGNIHNNSFNNGTLTFDQSFIGTYAGNIDGTGSLIKAGVGIATFLGDHTYVGTTSVNAGTLVVEGSINGGTTIVAVGATLGGNGTINTQLDIAGILAPGASAGELTANRAVNFAATSAFSLELNGPVAGTGYDQLTIGNTGSITITGGNVSLSLGYEPAFGQQFTVINNLSSVAITGVFSNLADGGIISATFNSVQYDFVADYQGGDGNDLVLTVPEPASATVLAVGLGLSAGLRRFRRRLASV